MHNAALGAAHRSRAASPPAFEILRPRAKSRVLLVCDHASNRVPPELDGLGLDANTLARHIGWDIGAAAVTRLLSRRLDAAAVLSGVSRLVIDCNRPPESDSSIPPTSDGVIVPGNAALSAAQARARAGRWFRPYHDAIARQIARIEKRGAAAILVSIHSFTPRMNGAARPWPVGILWNRDGRLALPVIASLRARGLVVGDNEPYSGRLGGYTVAEHAERLGRPNIAFEIRQDEIAGPTGIRRWAALIAETLAPTLKAPGLDAFEPV